MGSDEYWTAERVAELRRLWAAGRTGSEIAATFGDTTRNAVLSKAYRLGLPARGNPRGIAPVGWRGPRYG